MVFRVRGHAFRVRTPISRDRDRPSKSDDELKSFAKEHLWYDIWMLFALADYLENGVVDVALSGRTDKGLPARNAVIEAFAIHARALSDFFFWPDAQPRENDALAADFVPGWTKPERTPALTRPAVTKRVGFEIAHLSYGRLTVAQNTKDWSYSKIANEMAVIVQDFASRAPAKTVGADFKKDVAALLAGRAKASLGGKTSSTVLADATMADSGISSGGTATQMPSWLSTQMPSGATGPLPQAPGPPALHRPKPPPKT